jgi:hypothetical protein
VTFCHDLKENNMNQNLMVHFEVTKNERTYTFQTPAGAPLGEAYDCCHEMLTQLVSMASKAAENAKAAQPVDPEPAVEPEVV